MEINSYQLSRAWFNFCFDNPDLICPNHTALYFFIIEHCNRLGWKEKFGLPMEMAKEAIGIKNYRTYAKTFQDLIDWGFIKLIQKSKNQYSANVIAIVKNAKASTKALDIALQKHSQKQRRGTVGIDKQYNNITNEPINNIVVVEFSENFIKSKHYRLLIEKEKYSEIQISDHLEIFIAQKDAFEELQNKSFADICKNFYYWMPKYIKMHPQNGLPERGIARILAVNKQVKNPFL